jgi:hypothetical protein
MTEQVSKANGAVPVAEVVTPKNLIEKLAEIVDEIDNVDKRGTNTFQNYKFVKAADVAWLVRKALSARNIYMVADVIEIRNYEIPAKEGHMQAVDVKMEFSFHDGDSICPPIVLHSYGTGTDKGDKAVYKAMTGALKYGLRHAFLIPDESDPEADTSVDKATATENAKAVGEAKVAKMREKAAEKPAKTQTTLFWCSPDKFSGHRAVFLNLKEFGAGLNEVAAEGLRQILKKYLKGDENNGMWVPTGKAGMEALLVELEGCGVPTKQLQSNG